MPFKAFLNLNFNTLLMFFWHNSHKKPRMGGAALTVYHHNKKVVDVWAGVANKDGKAWQADSMSISYSTTKGVLSTLAHILVDEGLLSYDRPIADYWPAFAQNGKHGITLRHVLTHEAGLYHLRSMINDAREMLDWPHMLQMIEQAKPLHAAGARVGYHAISFGWIVGGLIEKVTGEPLAQTLAKKITQPLKLDGCYIGVPESELYRCNEIIGAPRYKANKAPPSKMAELQQKITDKALRLTGFDPNTAAEALIPKGMSRFYLDEHESLKACIAGAGGVFTARSLAKIYAVLANNGELDGVRLLSSSVHKTVEN
jgi:CubicO group peptidase (beta-lactamase class C family)